MRYYSLLNRFASDSPRPLLFVKDVYSGHWDTGGLGWNKWKTSHSSKRLNENLHSRDCQAQAKTSKKTSAVDPLTWWLISNKSTSVFWLFSGLIVRNQLERIYSAIVQGFPPSQMVKGPIKLHSRFIQVDFPILTAIIPCWFTSGIRQLGLGNKCMNHWCSDIKQHLRNFIIWGLNGPWRWVCLYPFINFL